VVKPLDVYNLRRLASVEDAVLNGELDGMEESLRRIAERLLSLEFKDRPDALQVMLDARPDRDDLVNAMANVDPLGEPPPESVEPSPATGEGKESASLHTQSADSLEIVAVRASSFKIKPVEFLDGGIIPVGKLISIVGPGGAGKGMYWTNLVADFTRGRLTMGLEYPPPGPIEVLLVGCEDGYEDTVIPRLMAANADLEKIHILKGIRNEKGKVIPFSLQYLEAIEAYFKKHPGIKFASVDPIAGYVARAGVDENSDAELRTVLEPLSEIASNYCVTVAGIKHFNKDEAKSAVNRVGGSVAYVNVPRACYAVGVDPTNPHRRVLAPFKWNLNAPWPPSIAWSMELADDGLVDHILAGCDNLTAAQKDTLRNQLYRLHWEGEVKVSADDILERMSAAGRRTAKEDISRAATWLADKLRNGPVLAVTCAQEGEMFLGRPWPSADGISKEEHQRRCNARIKWWREQVLVARLNGESRKHGFQGQSYFLFPAHVADGLWPPKLAQENTVPIHPHAKDSTHPV
jgi:hypothetical protein